MTVSFRFGILVVVMVALSLVPRHRALTQETTPPNSPASQSEEEPSEEEEPSDAESPAENNPFAPQPADAQMDNQKLDQLLRQYFGDDRVEGGRGSWRIVPPIPEVDDEVEQDDGNPFDQADPPESDPADFERPATDPQETDDEAVTPDDDESGDAGEDQNAANPQAGPGQGERLPLMMMVLTDQRMNRMRVMMPIQRFDPNKLEDLQMALVAIHANFDRALDARYAVKDGVLWSVFIHPLGSLTPAGLDNALQQVQTLRSTTGSSFTSSGMMFGPVVRRNAGNEA